MEEYIRKPLRENIDEMFIGPFGSSLKNEAFVEKKDAYCMVYEQKHAIQKTMNVETRYVTKEKYEELKRFNIKGGDIIVSCRGTIGETFVVPLNAPLGIMHPSIMKIRLKEDVYDKQYFNLLLIKYLKEHEAEANGSGVKMAISAKELSEICFPIPPIDVQKNIVSLFENVDNMIHLRKQQLSKLDELVKARFVELFDKYGTLRIGDVFKTTSGGTPSKTHPEYYESGTIPWLSSGEVNAGIIHSVKNFITQAGVDNSSAKMVPKNTVVIAMYGATAGQVGLLRIATTTNQAVCSVLPDSRYVPEYLYYAIKSKKDWMISQCAGGAQPNISQGVIKRMEIVDAPFEAQKQFATFVEQTDQSKLEIQKSLQQLETLKKALMQKYFGRGGK